MSSKELTAVKEETLDAVSKRIKALQSQGEIHFPPDYSPQNALKSAWLILQNTVDKDKRPVLDVCTKASILNSLMDMVITGLNPAKDQGYFIAYGSQLAFQRSYFGSEALAKRIDPEIEDIIAEPVYEGDDFQYEIVMGRKRILKHKQTIESINSGKIKAAYCMVIRKDGDVKKTELMTFDEIKKAWAMSKMHPIEKDNSIKAGSTHDEFTAEMCRKTIINRTCKPIINSSDDKHLKIAAMRSEVVAAEAEAAEQIEYHANQEIIDIDPEGDPGDPGPGPETTEGQKQEQTWDPCTAELQQRYPADKASILKAECERRNINISGLLPRQAHDVLLKAIKEKEQKDQGQGTEPPAPGQGEQKGQEEPPPPGEPDVGLNCSRKGRVVHVEADCMKCPDREDDSGRIICPHYQAYMDNINGNKPQTAAAGGGGPDF